MLAQVPIAGGAPREILDDVETAEWSPDGDSLAIVRTVEGHCRLEFPIGTEIARSGGWISHPRFSPDGTRMAIVDHPFVNDDRGTIVVIDLKERARRAISPEYHAIEGLAWNPAGDEVWFGAELEQPEGRAIVAATMRGKTRTVVSGAGWLWLHDIAPDGRLLVSQQTLRGGISAIFEGESKERDLSWLDYSVVRDLSDDGRTLLFSESGEAGGSIFGIYIRRTDGSPAVRLGEGTSEALSPDGKWVLSIPRDEKPAQIVMLPVGAGQPRDVTNDRINHRNARFSPDGTMVLFQGNEPKAAPRLWVQPIGGAPRAITPENVSGTLFTPDGKFVLGRTSERLFNLYPIAGGDPQPVPALQRDDVPIQFAPDGRSVFVSTFGKVPAVLTKVDLESGVRTKWREVMPPEASGLINVGPVWPTPDARTIVYSHARLLSDLYLVRGAR
jgi:Tol biopolymer transport system component